MYEGERKVASANTLLGRFTMHDLLLRKAGEVAYRINFSIDSNGCSTITAQLLDNEKNFEF